MIRTFQHKLVLSFLLIFAICTLGIALFERQKMQYHKREALQEKLNTYVDVIDKYLRIEDMDESMEKLSALLPNNLRITLIPIIHLWKTMRKGRR